MKHLCTVRARSLYSSVDDSSDELDIGRKRKKNGKSAFILFSPPTCHKTALHSYIFRYKTCQNQQKINEIHRILLLFFSLLRHEHAGLFCFFIFFFPTRENNPCRDPSTVEYSECALMDKPHSTDELKHYALHTSFCLHI